VSSSTLPVSEQCITATRFGPASELHPEDRACESFATTPPCQNATVSGGGAQTSVTGVYS
jgi:hypothetical protein